MAKETMKKPSSRKTASGRGAAGRTDSGRTSVNRTASAKKGSSKKKKAAKKRKRMLIFAVEIVLLLVLIAGFYVVRHLDMLQKPENSDSDQVEKNENLSEETVESLSGYTNVALFGLDTRKAGQLGKGNRSDTMIIASINNDTKQVKLVSVYRDTYLDLTNGKFNKCNGAYNAGGPVQAITMLNRNLDLDIEYYISVDFAALTKVVDLLGGIYIDVDEAEISHLNNYTEETSKVTGVSTTKLTKTGLQLLDGVQATSYCRIRYTAGDDYKRTERQREVIMELVNTAKKADISKINEIINTVFPMIATNYSNDQLISLASEMLGYEIVDTTGFPFEKTSVTVSGKGSCVVPIDLADNVKQLHEYLFENYDYTPSSEVQSISDEITKETGY
jgi:LCP family protein required for cell wall assembly